MGTTWLEEMKEELRFAMICHGNTKVILFLHCISSFSLYTFQFHIISFGDIKNINLLIYIQQQTVRKPQSENSSLASGKSGSSSSSDKSNSKSNASSAEKGGEPSPPPSRTISKLDGGHSGSATTAPRADSGTGHYPRNVHSSQSSVENHYPKSNGSNPYGYVMLQKMFKIF